jgi:hypothetical protein
LERLEAEALERAPADRAGLAHRLIDRRDDCPDEDPTEVELAWEREIQRRVEEYRRGEVQTVSSADVFAKARGLLK